jgi:hypothetical protein
LKDVPQRVEKWGHRFELSFSSRKRRSLATDHVGHGRDEHPDLSRMLPMRPTLLGFALVAMLVLGCAPLGGQRFTVEIGEDESASTLTVIDETGLIVNVTSGAPLVRDPVAEPAVVPSLDDPRQLGVVWTGGICSPRPVLTARRGSGDDQLSLILDDGPSQPAVCEDIGVFFRVTLHFSTDAPPPDAVAISRE